MWLRETQWLTSKKWSQRTANFQILTLRPAKLLRRWWYSHCHHNYPIITSIWGWHLLQVNQGPQYMPTLQLTLVVYFIFLSSLKLKSFFCVFSSFNWILMLKVDVNLSGWTKKEKYGERKWYVRSSSINESFLHNWNKCTSFSPPTITSFLVD